MVTSAWRLYREQPRLFLGIGLLFVPIGVLITFVHYLIFRVGGLAPLVNSVGASNALVATLAIILGGLFTVAGLAIVQSVTAIAIVELDDERSVTALAAYKLALGRLRPLFGAIVLAAVILAILEPTAVARREQKHRAAKRAEQQGDARDEERERAGAPRSTS